MKKLFHGSPLIIEKPNLLAGKIHNDFGQGFYCTENKELAAEWACKHNTNGYVNAYELNYSGLKILDLMNGNYSVLNWIAILLANRTIRLDSDISEDTCKYIMDYFSIDIDQFDLIIGYRADDSYFSYAEAWLNNALSLQSLSSSLMLGKLGEQIVLKSEKAFNNLKFTTIDYADRSIYYPKFIARDNDARLKYRNLINKETPNKDAIYAIDFIRKEIRPDDTCLQPFILKRCEE